MIPMHRFTYLVLFSLSVLSACAGEEPRAPADVVTLVYAQERRGYTGLEGVWLAQHVPDYAINRDDLIAGWVHADIDEEIRGLLRFNDLRIPPGSRILSAELSLPVTEARASPSIAVHGLLKDWKSGNHEWAIARAGETSWNSRAHTGDSWAAPGAGLAGTDYRAEPDAVLHMHDVGRFSADVTASFTEQFEAGTNLGWILKASERRADRCAVFRKDRMRLTVRFVPPPGAAVSTWKSAGPIVIGFDLAYASAVASNVTRAGELPFQGATFWGVPDDGGQRWLCNSVMGPDPIRIEDYTNFIHNVQTLQVPPSPLQHNFLRLNLTVPGTLTMADKPYTWPTRPRGHDKVTMWWAEGFDQVVENAGVAAEVARRAGMKGLFLDWESYGGDVWSFDNLADAAERGKSLDETRVQVHDRAGAFIRGIGEVYPDITIIVIFHLYTDQEYLLWNDFCDGMIAAAGPRMRIVNGNEKGYYRVSKGEFRELYDWHYRGSLKYCTVPAKYLRQTEVGFGVYTNWKGWGPDPELYTSTAHWQTRLENALEITDGYVWVYTGGAGKTNPDWWTGRDLPQARIDAVRKAIELVSRRKAAE